jgi:hypothetical protein
VAAPSTTSRPPRWPRRRRPPARRGGRAVDDLPPAEVAAPSTTSRPPRWPRRRRPPARRGGRAVDDSFLTGFALRGLIPRVGAWLAVLGPVLEVRRTRFAMGRGVPRSRSRVLAGDPIGWHLAFRGAGLPLLRCPSPGRDACAPSMFLDHWSSGAESEFPSPAGVECGRRGGSPAVSLFLRRRVLLTRMIDLCQGHQRL